MILGLPITGIWLDFREGFSRIPDFHAIFFRNPDCPFGAGLPIRCDRIPVTDGRPRNQLASEGLDRQLGVHRHVFSPRHWQSETHGHPSHVDSTKNTASTLSKWSDENLSKIEKKDNLATFEKNY